MFPADVQTYLTNEDMEISERDARTFNGTTFLYDFKKGDYVYRNGAPIIVQGQKALEIWIEKVIRTERFKFKIYDNVEYGVTIEDLIGSNLPYSFLDSEMKRELTESILKNPFIENLSEWKFEREGSLWTITFTVESVYGSFEMEVER
ncbi:DUF2634 domain-containing protein [Lysinibacillus pakistanensis]|uniref:DUF2634 domain-containing protein n=1 Tax=Lysinibacillus pakistanensis TaxID=759811 RepID=UPI003D2DB4B0